MKKAERKQNENIRFEWPEMPELFFGQNIIEYNDGHTETKKVICEAISIRGERWKAETPMKSLDDMATVRDAQVAS